MHSSLKIELEITEKFKKISKIIQVDFLKLVKERSKIGRILRKSSS